MVSPYIQGITTYNATVTAASGAVATPTAASLKLLATGGVNGSLIDRIWAIPQGTTTATAVVLYSSKDSGVTFNLVDSELMAAYTTAVTTANPESVFGNYSKTTPKKLMPNERLYVGIEVAQAAGVMFFAEGGDF